MSDKVVYRVRNGVADIRLNRPEKKNAILGEMYAALADGLAAADADEAVGAILLGGEGGAFTAGNDLADFLQWPGSDAATPLRRFMTELVEVETPVVAAVDGVAVGIGFTLLLHCDLVVLSTRVRLRAPFIDLGLVPEFASSLLLPRRIGRQRAAEVLLLGEAMDAAAAQACGLANRVVEPDELETVAFDYARRLAAKPKAAMRESRRLLREPTDQVLERIDRESEVFDRLLGSPEAKRAFAAFLDKRPPASQAS